MIVALPCLTGAHAAFGDAGLRECRIEMTMYQIVWVQHALFGVGEHQIIRPLVFAEKTPAQALL